MWIIPWAHSILAPVVMCCSYVIGSILKFSRRGFGGIIHPPFIGGFFEKNYEGDMHIDSSKIMQYRGEEGVRCPRKKIFQEVSGKYSSPTPSWLKIVTSKYG
jgi:hypothetical protein